MSRPKSDSTPAFDTEGFTLKELDEFGTLGGPNTLPFPLDHPIWTDKRNRPQILAAIAERRRG
jgi:hypothetical protein